MISNKKKIVYLIGMMGVGKTTTAPILAQQLRYSLADTDLEVEKIKRQSCHEIVDQIGVDGFRTLETKALAKLASHTHLVVACGGGIVLRQENWYYLRQDNAIVIWFDLPLEEIYKRIQNNPRPNLKGLDSQQLKTKLAEIYKQRRSLYCKTSHIRIVINPSETPQEIANKLIKIIMKIDSSLLVPFVYEDEFKTADSTN